MKLFLALKCSDIVFITLINVKMQMNFMLSSVEHEHFVDILWACQTDFKVMLTSNSIPEVSSIMRELAGRSLTGTYLYSLCVKPDINTTSASKRSHY